MNETAKERRARIEREVIAAIVDVARAATAQGLDGMHEVHRVFPGIPGEVMGEVIVTLMEEETADWWDQVERTIDGEIIKKALVVVGGGA